MKCGTVRRPWFPVDCGPHLQIPLSGGAHALIDAADLPIVAPYAWCAGQHHYATTQRNRCAIYMHRLILEAGASEQVDHINFDGLDNRRANLRLCTRRDNQRHRRSFVGRTRFKGAAFHKQSGLYHATILIDRRQISLGYFRAPEDAAAAYDIAAVEHFGEFALTNRALGLLQ